MYACRTPGYFERHIADEITPKSFPREKKERFTVLPESQEKRQCPPVPPSQAPVVHPTGLVCPFRLSEGSARQTDRSSQVQSNLASPCDGALKCGTHQREKKQLAANQSLLFQLRGKASLAQLPVLEICRLTHRPISLLVVTLSSIGLCQCASLLGETDMQRFHGFRTGRSTDYKHGHFLVTVAVISPPSYCSTASSLIVFSCKAHMRSFCPLEFLEKVYKKKVFLRNRHRKKKNVLDFRYGCATGRPQNHVQRWSKMEASSVRYTSVTPHAAIIIVSAGISMN